MTLSRRHFAAPLLLAAARTSSAQNPPLRIDPKPIHAALDAMVQDGRAAGVSALVWHQGKEACFAAAGFADRESKRPMARDTIAQIYSMTKPVTGVALMRLWEQGKFGLDDPLSVHLPEFASTQVLGKDGLRPPVRPISIRDVLRHTAGFVYGPGESAAHQAYVKADPLNLSIDLPELGRRLAQVPLLFDPGARWYYSIAVDVQALLVEKLAAQPFAAYVRQHLLDPLKMNETAWRQPDSRLPRFASLYRKQKGQLIRAKDEDARRLNFQDHKMRPGGFGLASTLDDYLRFARMLLNLGELDGVRILKPSTVRLMATDHLDARVTERHFLPTKGSLGFGFDFAVRHSQPQNPAENRGAVGEFFWDGAATTLFWVDPANQLAAVFFAQVMPHDGSLPHDFRAALYGPNYLGPKGD